ncbi:MAG: efflux RND transporter periplasmic adaptor subunit [Steroidobacteraceae bacterium]
MKLMQMNRFAMLLACLLGTFTLLSACSQSSESPGTDEHADADEVEKGPHGGRLLEDGDFTVELAIFETGVPPEYRAWVSKAGVALPLDQVELTVQLTRLDGEQNIFHFKPQQDFLRGDATVNEPHSFAVSVTAQQGSERHQWTYDSFEGRVTIPAASAQAAGLQVAKAGPQLIRDVLPLFGRVALNPEAVREVSARFPGTVKSVEAVLGTTVKAGAVLARVESSDSLQVYSVTAPISGTITERRTNPGQAAGSEPLFVISDLTQRWIELSVFPKDLSRIRVGQRVRIKAVDDEQAYEAEIVRISPAGIGANQSLKAWARLKDAVGLTPGQYANAEVLIGGAQVPLAVESKALQAFRDFTVVFERVGETYEVRMLELGRRDGEYVEVLAGLKPGTEYVTENSYLIKADIEKSGASHDH